MDIVERLTPETEVKVTLENITLPIVAAVAFQVFFIILNLIDGKDDTIVSLAGGGNFEGVTTGFTIMAILLAFWIGIAAVNAGGNIGDALVGSAIVGFVYGLLTSLFQEVFFDTGLNLQGELSDDYFKDGFFGKSMILNILYLTVLFIMIGFIAAGIAEELFGDEDDKPVKKSPAKKAPAKKAQAKKKTTKKATKAE